MFYGTFKNIQTVKEMRKEAARKLGKSVRDTTLEDIEASIEFQKDFNLFGVDTVIRNHGLIKLILEFKGYIIYGG